MMELIIRENTLEYTGLTIKESYWGIWWMSMQSLKMMNMSKMLLILLIMLLNRWFREGCFMNRGE